MDLGVISILEAPHRNPTSYSSCRWPLTSASSCTHPPTQPPRGTQGPQLAPTQVTAGERQERVTDSLSTSLSFQGEAPAFMGNGGTTPGPPFQPSRYLEPLVQVGRRHPALPREAGLGGFGTHEPAQRVRRVQYLHVLALPQRDGVLLSPQGQVVSRDHINVKDRSFAGVRGWEQLLGLRGNEGGLGWGQHREGRAG